MADHQLIVGRLSEVWAPLADEAQAHKMSAYLKDQFDFLGIPAPDRRRAQNGVLAELKTADISDVLNVADLCWAEPQREFHYAATDLLRSNARRLGIEHLARIESLIRTQSWWDTVDTLAVHVVGRIGRTDPAVSDRMDLWIDDSDLWIARTAILHQLDWKDATDQGRLFAYVRRRCADEEFFIRKALGWALRTYSRTNPEAVRDFAATDAAMWSGLTYREATRLLPEPT